eukprot:jgi/Psemu1/16646/gm1.16646_g
MPSPPAFNFSPALALPGEDGLPGGSGMASGRLGMPNTKGGLFWEGHITGHPHTTVSNPTGNTIYGGHRIPMLKTQILHCPTQDMRCGTYLFIETKPGVLSATVCLPLEAVIDEETFLEQ